MWKWLAPGRSSVTVLAIENELTTHLNELDNELVLYYNYKFGIFIRLFYIRYMLQFIHYSVLSLGGYLAW